MYGVTVDAAHSEKNQETEYRAVLIETDEQLFYKNLGYQTVNIGEFLGLVEAVKWVIENNYEHRIVWCDSQTAIAWFRDKHTSSNKKNKALQKACLFLQLFEHEISSVEIKHWNSKLYGEIPSDFKNKGKSTVTCDVDRT